MINYSNFFVNEGKDYLTYSKLIEDLLKQGKTTGPDHSEAMLHYSKMNVQRMRRVDKTVHLTDELLELLKDLQGNYRFLVISEGWCGDAAQIVPVFNKIAEASKGKIELRIVLRDQHLDLIDAHLTNGGRAIPVLLVLDKGGRLIDKWGPRPIFLQTLLAGWKKETSDMMVVAERLHGWYAKDRTLSTQAELLHMLSSIVNRPLQ